MGRTVKVFIAIVIIALLGVLGYFQIMKWHDKGVQQAVVVERKIWEEKTDQLEEQVAGLEQEVSEIAPMVEPETAGEKTTPKPVPGGATPVKAEPQKTAQERILEFFAYLDQQPYVAAYRLEQGTRGEFITSVELLSVREPVLVGETDSLHRLLKNMAHLYGVLGKKRINLTREVIKNESARIEPVMKDFYLWMTEETGADAKLTGQPSPQMLYDYSAFFLNTIAGRGYLSRRDPKLRLLTQYYATLLLDRANDQKLNSLGIDIRPHIQNTYRDIRYQIGLRDRRAYLAELRKLARKYKVELG